MNLGNFWENLELLADNVDVKGWMLSNVVTQCVLMGLEPKPLQKKRISNF